MAEAPSALNSSQAPRDTGRTLRNVISNWGTYLFTLVVNFFLAPYVVHHLGDSVYGVWTLIVSLTGYLGLLDFGVRGAVTRYVAKFHTESKSDSVGRVASSALVIFSVAGFLALAISLLLAFFALDAFHIPPAYRTTAQIVLILGGASVAVSLVSGVFGGIIVGLQRFDLLNGIEILITGLRALAIVIALWGGKGLVALACIQLVFTAARGLANAGLTFRLYPGLRIRLAATDRDHLRMIFSFSVYAFLIHISVNVIYYTDSVVIGAFLPVSMITFFAIGGNLIEYMRGLLSGISQTMSPLASTLEARQDLGGLRDALLTSSRFATMVALPIALTFMLRGGTFIGLWMGPQYATLSGQILAILALMMLFSAAVTPAGSIMLGISKHKPIVPVRIAEALCNLVLSVIWVRTMGVLGVAWGTTIPSLAFSIFYWPWYIHRTLAIRPLSYVVSSWIRPGVAILPFALCTYAFERLWPASNLAVFFLQVAATLPLALGGFWLLCFTQVQRQIYPRHFWQFVTQLFSRS